MSFLPTDYKKIPVNSDYFKFKDGDNDFRVLSSAVVGYEYWNLNNKPIRSKERWDGIPADCKPEKDGTYKMNHFWAFVVWNYEESRVQILQVTQKQVMKQLKDYVDNVRWGDPKMYDITVKKSGTGFDTEYTVQANAPIGEPDPKISAFYAKKPVNLECLFDGTDPFGGKAQSQAVEIEQASHKRTPAEIVAEASGGKFAPQSHQDEEEQNPFFPEA
jgi:hypothetical protein